MVQRKLKTVFSADPEQVRRIRAVVQQSRHYRSVSELLREAIDEKLERLRRESLGAQVDRYCREGHGDEDAGLIEGQAFARKR
jgi:Arc/MetJ-type ribon-helix-helix transcriptional regulator